MGASMDESAPGSTTTSSSFSEDKSMDTVIHVKNISCKFQSRTQLEKAESVMLGLVGDAACSKSNNDANNRKDHKNFHIANDSVNLIFLFCLLNTVTVYKQRLVGSIELYGLTDSRLSGTVHFIKLF